MSAVLLASKGSGYTARRLSAELEERSLPLLVVDPLECSLRLDPGAPTVLFRGAALSPRGVLPRFGPGLHELAVLLLRQLEGSGAVAFNSAQAIDESRDKFRCLQRLAKEGLAVPRSFLSRGRGEADPLAGFPEGPVVVKVLRGSQGTGVVRLADHGAARRFLRIAWAQKQNVLVQEWIPEAARGDLRALVVSGRLVAAMARRAGTDFRSNLHAGGTGEGVVVPSAEVASCATASATAVGLDVAGVDLVDTERGPVVLEVNASPGLEGIERATGENVAGAIADGFVAKMSGRAQ